MRHLYVAFKVWQGVALPQVLKAKYYIRDVDDFVVLPHDKRELLAACRSISTFLQVSLQLELHPHQVSVGTVAAGIDFLGWMHFRHHRVLRTATKKRMFRRLIESGHEEATVQSCVGLLGYGNAYRICCVLKTP